MRAQPIAWLATLGMLLACAPALAAAQVYRCTSENGSVAYQDQPCAPGQRQDLLDLPGHAPAGYVPPPAPGVTSTADAVPAPSARAFVAPPPAPLPMLYACVGAVNGQRYLARSPPPPYLAPLGVMGYPPQSLSQAYGAPGGAGVSAPEVAPKPRVTGPSLAAGMTEVADACTPAPPAEVCAFVQREYDANHGRLRAAVLPSERQPLQQREQALQDQLRNCR